MATKGGRGKKQSDEPTKDFFFVLFVDIAAFSKRPTVDQPPILEKLNTLVTNLPEYREARAFAAFQQIPTGDGFALVFPRDSLIGFRLGAALQTEAIRLKDFELRMGLHFGLAERVLDISDRDNLVGEGINMAARALTQGLPGEFLITKRAYEVLVELGLKDSRLASLGPTAVKHGTVLDLYKFYPTPPRSRHVDHAPHGTMPPARGIARSVATAKLAFGGIFPHLVGPTESAELERQVTRIYDKARGSRSVTATHETIAHRLAEIYRDVGNSLFIVLVAFALHLALEQLGAVQWAESAAYEALQSFGVEKGTSPVVVVDFDESINAKPAAGETLHPTTDLNKLQTVLSNLLAYQPKVIGIDVDFGPKPLASNPNEQVYPTEDYPGFLPFVKAQTTPIVLGTTNVGGVNGALGNGDWVADDDLNREGRAAHLFLPLEDQRGQIYLFNTIQTADSGPTIPSLSFAVAGLYRPKSKASWVQGFAHMFVTAYADETLIPPDREGARFQPLKASSFFLNYAAESQIYKDRLTVNPTTLALASADGQDLQKAIAGKAVILGSITTEGDILRQPRNTNEMVSGLMIQALGVDTLVHSPLYQFKQWFRLLLDLVSGGIVAGFMLAIRRRYIAEREEIAEGPASLISVGVVALTTVAIGISLIRLLDVLWLDMYMALLLVLLHPQIEHHILDTFAGIGRTIVNAWRSWLFRQER